MLIIRARAKVESAIVPIELIADLMSSFNAIAVSSAAEMAIDATLFLFMLV